MPPARAVGSVFTRPSPTSRGLGRCVSFRMGRGREQTAAGPRAGACRLRGVGRRCLAPVGKGCCRYAGSTLFALRAKALQSGAPDHGVSRERAGFSERFTHQGNLPARRGTGERAAPRRGRRYTPSRRQNAPFSRQNLPHHPTAANAALYKARLIARRGKPPRRAPKTSVPRMFTTYPRLFTAHPRLFTTYPRLFTAHPVPVYGPSRAIYDLPTPLRSSHVFSGHSMPFAAPPRLYGFRAICGASPAPLRLSYACLWPLCAICDTFRVICGASCAFYDFPTPFVATPCLLQPIRACFRAIRAFNSHPVPVYGRLLTGHSTPVYSLSTPFMAFYDLSHAICGPPASFAAHPRLLRSSHACLRPFCTFYGHPAPAKVSFPPFPPPPSSSRIPQGERRALPAPAQGANPLRIPFWKTTSIASVSPSPKTPQADGPCSWAVRRVYALSPE